MSKKQKKSIILPFIANKFVYNRLSIITDHLIFVPVAQWIRATASEAVGRGFESLPERHKIILVCDFIIEEAP